MGIWDDVADCRSLFVGVETKVDEPSGNETAGARSRAGVRDLKMGKRTNLPKRVRDLVSVYAPGQVDHALCWCGSIRYQLLTGMAGTIAVGKEISVFLVLVFRTAFYDEAKGEENRRDYQKFIQRAHGRPVSRTSGGVGAYEVAGGREAVDLHLPGH